MSAKNKQIIDKINDSFAEGNIEGFLEHCADDVVWRMIGDKSFTGKGAIREFMTSTGGELPDFTIDKVIGDGDSVVTYGNMTMKNKDGKAVPYAWCDVYGFRDGKIATLDSYVIKTAETAQAETA